MTTDPNPPTIATVSAQVALSKAMHGADFTAEQVMARLRSSGFVLTRLTANPEPAPVADGTVEAALRAVLETGPWYQETGGDYGNYFCCGVSAGWMGRPGDPTSDPHDGDCPYIKAWALLGTDVMVRDTYPEATDAAE